MMTHVMQHLNSKHFAVGLTWSLLAGIIIMVLSGCGPGKPAATPTPTPTSEETLTPAPTPSLTSSSDLTSDPSAYDQKTVELSGQTYLIGSPPRLLVDGRSGVNISGNIAALQSGFYRLTGVYDADTNMLNVTESVKQQVEYLPIEAGKEFGINLVPVALQGLIATVPKEVADELTNYVSIPNFPEDLPIFPYVVYAMDKLYLILSDHFDILPTELTFVHEGTAYHLYFSAGEVKGTLVQTPMDEIDFGPNWTAEEFGGVIIAENIEASEPISTTVGEISNDPTGFAFKRVSIHGTYLVATATVDYSEIRLPFGVGILADSPTELFFEEEGPRLETIDPERKVWQLRQAEVIGTVLYPTEEVLMYLDYSSPLIGQDVRERAKPALIVDTLVDDVVNVADISELNPVKGNPRQHWGKVVEFDGYALGLNYPLKEIASAIAGTEIPVNVNLLGVGIADSLAIGSQLAIIGLNNELVDQQGEVIWGKYRFKVAVTQIPEELVKGVPYADTGFFLLSKEELPIDTPTPTLYGLSISVSPSGAGSVTPPGGDFISGTDVILTAVPALGYAFDRWSGDASGTDNPITIAMDSDKNVTAHFKSVTYILSVSIDPSGAGLVTLTPAGGNYPSGTQVTLTAVPAIGYAFDHWSGDASGAGNPITIAMDSNKNVTAHFKRIL